MSKDEVEAAIKVLETWGRTIDNWVLICAIGVAIFLAAEVIFSIAHWINDKHLRPLRIEQNRLYDEAITNATARAKEAELKLEQLRARVGTRVIDKDKFLAALKDKPKPQAIVIKRLAAAGDGWYVALQLDQLLREAGWPVEPGFDAPWNIVPADQSFHVGPAVAPDGPSSGIIVLYRYGPSTPEATDPFETLLYAIRDTLGGISGGQQEGIPDGTIWVVIFPRP
jgi:hypothetical protein